jgi:hexosaminidase
MLAAGDDNLTVIPSKHFFRSTGYNSTILEMGFKRYVDILFAPPMPDMEVFETFSDWEYETAMPALIGCNVNVLTDDETLQLGFDESYNLYIHQGTKVTAEITANTVFGALRGLETFAQLVTYDWNSIFYVDFVPINITDYPRYKHRGLLIDTSRHYLPLTSIFQVIDAMAATKVGSTLWYNNSIV